MANQIQNAYSTFKGITEAECLQMMGIIGIMNATKMADDGRKFLISEDGRAFKEKPQTNAEKATMKFQLRSLSLTELAERYSSGHTYASLYKDGKGDIFQTFGNREKNNRNYAGQSILFIDIDEYEKDLPWVRANLILEPTMICYTFSEGKHIGKHNMRLLYAFDSFITPQDYLPLMKTMDYMIRVSFREKDRILDYAAAKKSQMFFGTKKRNFPKRQGMYIYKLPHKSLMSLMELSYKEEAKKKEETKPNTGVTPNNHPHTRYDIELSKHYRESYRKYPKFWDSLKSAYEDYSLENIHKWLVSTDSMQECFRVDEELEYEQEERKVVDENGKEFAIYFYPNGKFTIDYPKLKEVVFDRNGNYKTVVRSRVFFDGEHRRRRLFTYGMLRKHWGCSYETVVYNFVYDQLLFMNNDDRVFNLNEIIRVTDGIMEKEYNVKPKRKYQKFKNIKELYDLNIDFHKYTKVGYKEYTHSRIKESINKHIGSCMKMDDLWRTVQEDVKVDGVKCSRRLFFEVKKEMDIYRESRENVEKKRLGQLKVWEKRNNRKNSVHTVEHTHTTKDNKVSAHRYSTALKNVNKLKIRKVSNVRKLKIFTERYQAFSDWEECLKTNPYSYAIFNDGGKNLWDKIKEIGKMYPSSGLWYYCYQYCEHKQLTELGFITTQVEKFRKLKDSFTEIVKKERNAAAQKGEVA